VLPVTFRSASHHLPVTFRSASVASFRARARIDFSHETGTSRAYFGGTSSDGLFEFTLQADAGSLPSGRYVWNINIGYYQHVGDVDVPIPFYQTSYQVAQDVINRDNSDFGTGWELPELDRLAFSSFTIGEVTYHGVDLITGTNHAVWYTTGATVGDDTSFSLEGQNPYASGDLIEIHTGGGGGGGASLSDDSETYTLTAWDGTKSVFDSDGLLRSRVDRLGNTLRTYDYDENGILTSITDGPTGHITHFENDGTHITSATDFYESEVPGVAQTTTFRYEDNRLVAVTTPDPDGETGSTYSRTYDLSYYDSGRVESRGDYTYTYDATGQLTEASGGFDGGSWQYDDNGNRVSYTSYMYTSPDHTIGQDNRLMSDGNYTYEYDNEGNLVKRTDIVSRNYTTYTWDNRNRLTFVYDWDAHGTSYTSDDTNISTVAYIYDAFNQLIRRVSTTGTNKDTIFVYEDGQVVFQFDRTNYSLITASNLSHRYVWNPEAVDQLLADEQVTSLSTAGSTYWAMTDDQGSVRDVIDSSGNLRIERDFSSFGDSHSETHYGAYIDEAFEFTGRWFDPATGLQNNTNRWYDPSLGRWMNEDPIGFNGGDANLYRYVGNQPTTFVDPQGLWLDWIVSPMRSWRNWRRGNDLDDKQSQIELRRSNAEMAANPGSSGGQDRLIRDQNRRFGAAKGPISNLAEGSVQFTSCALGGAFLGGPAASAARGLGNIGSHAPVEAEIALSGAEDFLGAGYTEIAPGVFRSADGLRQFRMTNADLLPTHGNIGPHVHFEIPNPAGGPPRENLHLPIKP
jgi:RHS repeat-associated protein